MWYNLLDPKLAFYVSTLPPHPNHVHVHRNDPWPKLPASGLKTLFAKFAKWRRRHAAILSLESLDPRLLRDIGLERGEIPAAVDAMLAGVDPRSTARATVHSISDGRRPDQEVESTKFPYRSAA